MITRNGGGPANGDQLTYDSENRLVSMSDDSSNLIASYNYDQSGRRSKKVLKDGSIVYEFGGVFEIAIPNGQPQQQTIYIHGIQGEIVGQMTNPGATLLTDSNIRDNNRYAIITSFTNRLKNNFKKFVNNHVVANSKFLFKDHSSVSFILMNNDLSYKARIMVLISFVLCLFYLASRQWNISKQLDDHQFNPFVTFSTPLVLSIFLITFGLGGCMGLSHHSSQTPWGALGLGLNSNTPTLGAGSSTSGFGSPGQGGGSTGSGMNGEGALL
jgi:YD repeat-containing protein